MKFKLDENFGRRTQNLFQIAGHDVQTTLDEKIQGCSDRQLYQTCCAESRCLVTLDLDFSDVTRFRARAERRDRRHPRSSQPKPCYT